MSAQDDRGPADWDGEPGPGDLFFVPLGGSGEFGINLNAYGHDGKWIVIDCGLGFGDETTPGIELVVPDTRFLEGRRREILAIILTHGHEDHLGALAFLWPKLKVPVYASPFTLELAKSRLEEHGLLGQVPLKRLPFGGRLTLGPFEIDCIPVTHSIPESQALAIRTAAGTVLHTGDWKLDPRPGVGPLTDTEALRRVGEGGVLALVGDSTNAMSSGHSKSETDLAENLSELFGRLRKRIVVTCFASNVARMHGVALAAERAGRQCVLVGRSLKRAEAAARAVGYLRDVPPFVPESEAAFLPRERVVYLATGSQGEPRAAMARLADGTHPELEVERGDTVIFSSRDIPGNEKEITRLQYRLGARGVEVLTDRDDFVHVSGHAYRDELVQMYQWVRPRVAIPVHGERHHQQEHAKLARDCQVPEVVIPENGSVIRLAPGPAKEVGRVPTGVLGLDGTRLVRLDGDLLRQRGRIATAGLAVVTLVMDGRGKVLSPPVLSVAGVLEGNELETVGRGAVRAIGQELDRMPPGQLRDDDSVVKAVRGVLRRHVQEAIGKKPNVEVHLVRV